MAGKASLPMHCMTSHGTLGGNFLSHPSSCESQEGGQDASKKEKMSASGLRDTKSTDSRGRRQVDLTEPSLTLRRLDGRTVTECRCF
uniref:Uncharacterized protein n=1 Tax=Amphiprion percula TaxID=161767 RepID=A0A3P8SN32_AMPPE